MEYSVIDAGFVRVCVYNRRRICVCVFMIDAGCVCVCKCVSNGARACVPVAQKTKLSGVVCSKVSVYLQRAKQGSVRQDTNPLQLGL